MQTPVTVGIVGKNNCYKAAISSLLLAMTATSGCSSTPTTATPNPSLASGTATPQTSSEATHISEHQTQQSRQFRYRIQRQNKLKESSKPIAMRHR